MAKQTLNGVLQQLHKLAAVQTKRELSDGELVERFVDARDDGAFTVLIERHGPMVLGVCQRALPNLQDAEDACQATFLVLARKAASVRNKASLGSWLHGVARRVATALKRGHARRKSRELGANAPIAKDAAAEVTWREMQIILDEELERLPASYREPLILCYLECMSRDEAARQLGVSSTTLHGRLERARERLRESLTKRGLTLGAITSAALLSETVSRAALAPTLIVSSTKAAMVLAAGQRLTDGVVTTHVIALAQEVLKNMFVTKLKLGTAAVLCAGLFVAMIGGSFTSLGIAQETKSILEPTALALDFGFPIGKTESDLDFIRRISKDLRGTEPTPTEIHFFVTSKDAGRRQKLIDLFIQERQAKKGTHRPTDDSSNVADFEAMRLKHAKAADVAKIVDEAFNGPKDKTPRVERIRIVADPMTNSILLKAASDDVLAVRKMVDTLEELSFRSAKLGVANQDGDGVRTVVNLPWGGSRVIPDQANLKKSDDSIVGVFKKIDVKRNTLTFTVTTTANRSLDLTYPLSKGIKVSTDDKDRKEIKLTDIKPGAQIHVYVNEEADGSLGNTVMTIVVVSRNEKSKTGKQIFPYYQR